MAILDDVIGVFSPGWKAARLRSRAVIQAYEAVKTTRTHKARRENRTADQLSQYGAVSLREQARYLDNNHDLVIGVFDKLEERVVGKNGIIVEPHPVLRNGAIARDLAAEIRTRWSEWSVSPEVTGQFTRPMLERLMLRTWLRDGEVFAQMVSGRINSLTPSAGVHFWLEALEPDFIPMTSDESNRLNQGVFVDDWGRPEKYLVYKSRPVSGRQMETKEVDAERMLHLKFVRRLHQMRGTSLLSGVLIRLSALKEYEDSELTAARIAAALGMYIRKGDGQSYEPDGNGSKDKERELTIQPGIIYDDLKPGEEIGMVKSDRPNPNLETFRNGQVREGAEYKYVTTGDKQATIALATYGELFSITRQAIINDDLNMLTDVPMKLGRAAKSTIADLVYAILTSNPKISTDNVSLFDKAKHANVLESAAMDVASLDKARQLMRVQKEGERHLNIRPAFVLVPTAMESVANQVIRSSSVKGADINAGIINPVKDFATVIAEPRLDDNSQTTFYLAASKGSDTIEVAYLNGVDTPYIDQMEGFSVDGVTTKVRIDAGVAPVDHRGLVKCTA